jgi:alpha-mannosidase
MGLRFLKEEFGYHPKAAISADSFGHSQSTLAILAHLGI